MFDNNLLIMHCPGSDGLSASWRPCDVQCNEMYEGFFRSYPKLWMRHTNVC
jgi:hypothetical protein